MNGLRRTPWGRYYISPQSPSELRINYNTPKMIMIQNIIRKMLKITESYDSHIII